MKRLDKRLNKKSQMKTFESVAVLIIFFFLVGLGLIFYAGVQKTSLKQVYAERTEQEAIKIAMRVSYLPELLCSKRGIIEDDCFDVLKLESIARWTNFTGADFDEQIFLHYQRDFKESEITVKQIFPTGGETYTLYKNQPEEDKMKRYYIIPSYIPVSLRDPSEEDEYSMGLLTVKMFIPKI